VQVADVGPCAKAGAARANSTAAAAVARVMVMMKSPFRCVLENSFFGAPMNGGRARR